MRSSSGWGVGGSFMLRVIAVSRNAAGFKNSVLKTQQVVCLRVGLLFCF